MSFCHNYLTFCHQHFTYQIRHTLDNINVKNNISINPWQGPTPFTADFLQIDDDLHILANEQLDKLTTQKFQGWNTQVLRNFLNAPTNDLQNRRQNFVKGIKKFDQLRKTNFIKTFPELKKLLEL